ERAADGRAVDREDAPVVRLDEDADGVPAERGGEPPGAGPDPAFPAERDRARARAHAALRDGPVVRLLQRPDHVLGPDRAGADVVQEPVVRLADDGVDRAYALHPRPLQEPVDHGVRGLPDAERAGQEDRRLELAELPD